MISTTTFEGIDSLRISNGGAELVVSTGCGPRILSYRRTSGENILGLWLDVAQPNDLGTWKPYGGHRLWAAPESMPSTYYPDNDPIESETIDDNSVRLRAPSERVTNLQKEMRITLENNGDVAIQHLIANCGAEAVELAPWSLTILRTGGTVILPQEPYRSHDDYLLPARPMVLWHFTNLADPRFKIGQSLIEMACDPKFEGPQKIGVLNKQGWTAYFSERSLFVKEFDYRAGAHYPDYDCNSEAYTAGAFLELESLGPMELLQPGELASHRETWHLFENISLPKKEDERVQSLATLLEGIRK